MDPARNPRPRWFAALLLVSLAGVATPTRATVNPVDPDIQARGEMVMRRFCLSCHGSPGGKPEDPLGPRLRPEVWADPEQAYENLGQLWRISRRMDQPFHGTDAERRDLAAWLSRRAQENRPPAWKGVLPWAAVAAGLLVAGGIALRSRRRAPRGD